MLWAIDVGNTHTVVGVHDGQKWAKPWRLATAQINTEDDFAATVESLCRMDVIPFAADCVIVASVVPRVNESLVRFGERWVKAGVHFVNHGDQVGLPVDYSPSHAVGADRLANAIGALAKHKPPVIVVDFGTATTFDTIDSGGVYVGGAILPGLLVSLEGLVQHTAKLPQIELKVPKAAIGKTTVESLEAGLMFGYAGAIDSVAKRIKAELGPGVTVIATGGLGEVFSEMCGEIDAYDPYLTLDGLRISAQKMGLVDPR